MKLILASPRGFCAGVFRAIETVERALEIFGPPVFVKHEIVHNRHVIENLKKKGAIFIEDLESLKPGSKLIYSAHGVSPEVRQRAKELSLYEIDATCSLVARLHHAVRRYAQKGYKIVLIGHSNHVEIKGVAGEAPGMTFVIESERDIERLNFSPSEKIFFASQTTMSLEEVALLSKILKEKFPQAETIASFVCYATKNRQLALLKLTEMVDLIYVVGDVKSSNSNRLREIALQAGRKAFLINGPDEIKEEDTRGIGVIGLTAGASTPENVVQDCVLRLRSLGCEQEEELLFQKEHVRFDLPQELFKDQKEESEENSDLV